LTYLIDELEETLLRELQHSLGNTDADQKNVEQAAAILRAVEKVAESSQKPVEPPAEVAVQ